MLQHLRKSGFLEQAEKVFRDGWVPKYFHPLGEAASVAITRQGSNPEKRGTFHTWQRSSCSEVHTGVPDWIHESYTRQRSAIELQQEELFLISWDIFEVTVVFGEDVNRYRNVSDENFLTMLAVFAPPKLALSQ